MKIRPVTIEDGTELTILNREFFSVDRSNNFWAWKYFQLPTQSRYVVVLEDNGKIVGQIGCIVLSMRIGGKTRTAGQTVDILILKKFRRHRAFLRVEKKARALGQEMGAALDFGFSIEQTRKLSTRLLGFTNVTRVWKMTLPLNPTPYLENKLGSRALVKAISAVIHPLMKRFAVPKSRPLPRGWIIAEVARFDPRFDRLWDQVKDHHYAIVERSSAYLNWRYTDHPEVDYSCYALTDEDRLLGFVVLEIKENITQFSSLDVDYMDLRRGEIIDLLVAPGPRSREARDALLRKAFQHLLRHDVDVISCWCQPHMEVFKCLEAFRFRRRPTPHHLVVRTHAADLGPDSPVYKAESWYLMRGDSDHY